jgi:hypothetical protein
MEDFRNSDGIRISDARDGAGVGPPSSCITASARTVQDDILVRNPERLAAATSGARCAVVPGDHLAAVREALVAASAFEFSRLRHHEFNPAQGLFQRES